MKSFFLALTTILFSSTLLFAEYQLEPVNCTIKKKIIVVHIFIIAALEQHTFATQ